MTKHTAGPWVADNSRFLTSVNSANKKHIAMVNFFSCGKPEFDICGEEHEANARLIAAAPELLEALELALEWIDLDHPDGSYASIEIRKVITKAKGE